MLRQLREDARDFPATVTLCGLWIVVFLLMVGHQMVLGGGVAPGQFILGLGGGQWFGDMTVGELLRGELWRTVTSTFVHYGLLHIGLNVYAMYQLGCLVESWYGTGQFLAIYVITGGGGNLVSGLVRHALKYNPTMASGGGSVVVMALVGLCAVVGWRSRTRLGDYLKTQMIWVLLVTAAIGLALPVLFGLSIIDNWGHACGAAVGALVGLANRQLTRQVGTPVAKWAGWFGVLVLTASAAAQVADDTGETARRRRELEQASRTWADSERRYRRLDEVRQVYRLAAIPAVIPVGSYEPAIPVRSTASPAKPPAVEGESSEPDRVFYLTVTKATLVAFDSLARALDTGATAADFQRVKFLLERSQTEPPSPQELREIDVKMATLLESIRREREQARARMSRPLFGNRVR